MRYHAEHKARTRERVLKEAVLAIRSGGPGTLGVAGVMKRAGLTHGGFYAHFESRDALLMAAIDEMFATARGTFDRRTQDLPPREALHGYVRFYLSRGHRDARETGCLLPLLSSDLPRMDTAARQRFGEGVARLGGAMADKLRELGHPDPDDAAGSALCEMVGALALSRAVGDAAQSDAILMNSRVAVLGRLGLGDAA